MGRQSCDPTVIHSSIALLQERFRQLEKAKEMRQQRELLRLLSEAEQVKAATTYKPSRLFFPQEFMLPQGQSPQCSLSLQPNVQTKPRDLQVNETPQLENLWLVDTAMRTKIDFDESDVDTSLHL
ncbi:hypothetical protein Tsubulata_027960 [Turnera subulata]|uniref:Uncharacterized protein n=1 Tax=Turnera subulata TaxID=218843 RepID=A0A9Q0FVP4_9ROSI|nr:hypothetical protein Tsubulata_027960 [Turnera subulata]